MTEETRRRRPGGRPTSILVAAAMAAGLIVGIGAAAAPAAVAASRPVDAACGTWVLEQISSATDLTRKTAAIDGALSMPGVTGFSMRVSWATLENDMSLLDKGLAVARARGKEFSIRFMAGRYTPKRVFDAGAYSFVAKDGNRMPQPFAPDGTAGNPVFEREFTTMVDRLAAWSRQNGVRVLHLPWYGFLWAEIYNGAEIEAQPGYSWAAWLEGHKRLAQIGLQRAGSDLAVEFALSGHWGARGGGSGEVSQMLVDIAGADSPSLIVQGNGMGVFNNPATNRPIAHAKQMYGTGDYDWTQIYKLMRDNNEHYLEVYTPSFSAASKAKLATESQAFKTSRCTAGGSTDPDPDTDTGIDIGTGGDTDTTPTVTVTRPASTVSGTYTFQASASSGASVELLVDDTVVGTGLSVTWDSTQVANGAHQVSVRATDADGDVATDGPYPFTVDNTPVTLPTVSVASAEVTEGHSGNRQATVTLALSQPSSKKVTVAFRSQDGTATSGSDYKAATGTVAFPAGATTVERTFYVFGDRRLESDETFDVTLSAPLHATLGQGRSTVRVVNDDTPLPSLAISDVTVTESEISQVVLVPVKLSAPAASPGTVDYVIDNGSAGDADYVWRPGTVAVPAGATLVHVPVTIRGDRAKEYTEWLKVRLTRPVGVRISDPAAILTIKDDD